MGGKIAAGCIKVQKGRASDHFQGREEGPKRKPGRSIYQKGEEGFLTGGENIRRWKKRGDPSDVGTKRKER